MQGQGRIAGAILDLDGTMVHTAPDFHEAVNAMRAEFGLPPLTVETIIGFVGKGAEFLVRNCSDAEREGRPLPDFNLAMDRFFQHYAAVNGQHALVYPGVAEGLSAMRRQALRLACVTNKPSAFARDLLRLTKLDSHFDFIFGGDAFSRKKPDPLPLQEACASLGLKPQQVLVIGDSCNDAAAARAAGCPVLLVPYGYNHGHAVDQVDCDGIVQTLLEAADAAATWQGSNHPQQHDSR
jgi:phosphoglycolate phosphatase